MEHLTGNVERQVLRVDDTLHEVEVLGNELLAVVHDENTAHVQLDVVLLFAILKEIERSTARDEEQSAELELTFNGKVLDGQMVLPVVGQRLVELSVLVLADIVGVASPDGLGLVQLLVDRVLLLDRLLLLLVLFLVSIFIFTNIFNFGLLVLGSLVFLLLFLGLIIAHLLVALLLNQKLDWVANELGVLLDYFLDLFLLQVVGLILL